MTDSDLRKTVTGLLMGHTAGSAQALDELMPLVYDELRRLARRYMRSERLSHTLQRTALVNEVYLKLVDSNVSWKDRAHFYCIAARAMRRILVDHARAKGRNKRGGELQVIRIDEGMDAASPPTLDILDLDEALNRLAASHPRQTQILELRYFAGMTHEEIARALDLSASSVNLELRLARIWMQRELRG